MKFFSTGQSSAAFYFVWFVVALGEIQGACWTHSRRVRPSFLERFSMVYTARSFDITTFILPSLIHGSEYVVVFIVCFLSIRFQHGPRPSRYSIPPRGRVDLWLLKFIRATLVCCCNETGLRHRVSPSRSAYFASPWWLLTLISQT